MRTLSGSFVYEMDKNVEPAWEVEPGETVKAETPDCFNGQIKSDEDTLEDLDMTQVNPATGPIYVKDAEPGDTLLVTIEEIKVKSPGVQGIVPGFGLLQDEFDEPLVTVHEIDEEGIEFEGKKLPVHPMIGTIGVAPEGEPVLCSTPGAHGGNLDTPDVRPGVTLRFPVFHEGALLSLGDGHALQGDGEVCGVSIEVATTTTLTVDVEKETISTPLIEGEEEFIALGSDEDLEGACRIALRTMVDYLSNNTTLSPQDAYKLCSVATDMKVSQVVNPLRTARVSVKKEIVEKFQG